MELNVQIKRYRTELNLSQEELAEKIYVSRQSISNWENGKTYPDIHSLLLLSSLFGVSLDQLIKGDIEKMKIEAIEFEVTKLKKYCIGYNISITAMMLSVVPCLKWFGWLGAIPVALLFVCSLLLNFMVERIKIDNNVFTYKEIIAFINGKMLDEIEQTMEVGKRPYQLFLRILGSGMIAAVVCLILGSFIL